MAQAQKTEGGTYLGPIPALKDDLHILIIGGGMGGLSCALACAEAGFTKIDVYEQAPGMGFVGAGIQVAPNMARILDRLGVWPAVRDDAVELKETSIRKGTNDEELAHLPLPYIEESYGYPHMVAHRASLAGALFDGCKGHPDRIKLHLNHVFTEIDFDRNVAKFKEMKEGKEVEVEADVILAADGVKSPMRAFMIQRTGGPEKVSVDTGQAAYRLMLNREQMSTDPELLALLDSNCVTRWIAPRRHIIAYPIHRHTIYNLSTAHPDVNLAETDNWTAGGSKSDMLKVWGDYCPRMQKMLQLVPEGDVVEWKLGVHPPLKVWVEKRVGLMGDACHSTLPHLAQGAAQAIEDGATIGAVLSRIEDKSEVHAALLVYQRIRKPRADWMVETAASAGRSLHLTDEKAQAERDDVFRRIKDGGPNPDRWADPKTQEVVYGHDCVKEVADHWEEYFAEAAK